MLRTAIWTPSRKLIDAETAAIMIEPIQGEGGVRIPPDGFLQGLRQLADEHGLLLMFDEVQTGCGRTGQLVRLSAFRRHARRHDAGQGDLRRPGRGRHADQAEIAPSLRPGMHASTFGGNPIAARAGIAALEMIERDKLLDSAERLGEIFRKRLEALRQQTDLIVEVRVLGMMIGVELRVRARRSCKPAWSEDC